MCVCVYLFIFLGTLSSLGSNFWNSWNGRIETILGSKRKIGMSGYSVESQFSDLLNLYCDFGMLMAFID